jgi:putative copper resistance protein D
MHSWQFLGTWSFDMFPGTGIAAAAVAYLAAVAAVGRRARRARGRPWPRRRTASFLGGLALAWLVILGPVGAYDDTFFWAHMVQHIALMMMIAPLLLLGSPVLLLLRVASPTLRHDWIVPVLRSRALKALTSPLLTWLLFAGTLLGTHFSPFYNYALEHPPVHRFIEHPLYLGVALLFYYPLLPGNPCARHVPHPLRLLSLGLMMVPEALTGFFIYATSHLLYPFYATVTRPFGPNPLTDQQIGGSLMWGAGMLIDTGWIILAVVALLHADQARTRRLDAQIACESRRERTRLSPAPTATRPPLGAATAGDSPRRPPVRC